MMKSEDERASNRRGVLRRIAWIGADGKTGLVVVR